jgi:hypothetical protein
MPINRFDRGKHDKQKRMQSELVQDVGANGGKQASGTALDTITCTKRSKSLINLLLS